MITNVVTTQIVKGGGQTMFLDLHRAKNDKLYLTVTSLGRNQEGEAERRSVTIFEDQLPEFARVVKLIMKEVPACPKTVVQSVAKTATKTTAGAAAINDAG